MKKRTRSIIWGLLLILLAASLILWKLNIFNLPVELAGVSTWGLIIAAFMVMIIINSILDLSFGGIFIPLAIIAIVFDEALGITAITPWIVLIAAVLLTIAFGMLFPKHGKHHHKHHGPVSFITDDVSGSCEETGENGYIYYSNRFGSSTKYVNIPDLTKADITSSFGEMSVFFDKAQVPGKKVVVNVSNQFGEMNLFFPKNWQIDNKVTASLGSCNDRTNYTEVTEDPVVCIVQGSVSFGELNLGRI